MLGRVGSATMTVSYAMIAWADLVCLLSPLRHLRDLPRRPAVRAAAG
jgi:hypothetical protein